MNETKSVKALKKQLGAAIAMVTVAAVALGSSTYAWFAANNQVSATAGNVNAVGEGGIEIKAASAGDEAWATTATETWDEGALRPTSNKGDNVSTWYHATAALSSNSKAVTDTYTTVSNDANWSDGKVSEGTLKGEYYKVASYTIRPTAGSSANDLKVTGVTATSTTTKSDDLNKALRVLVVTQSGDNTTYALYAPLRDGASTYKIWNGTKGSEASIEVTAAASNTEKQVWASNLPANGVSVKVYAFFEGEDENLKSANYPSVGTDDISITVEFATTIADA